MDTQYLKNQEEIEQLSQQNRRLKKELEREQHLHRQLYNEWKELSDQVTTREREVLERNKPKTSGYKYAFYALLIVIIPTFYFLAGGNKDERTLSPGIVTDSMRTNDTASASVVTAVKEPTPANNSATTVKEEQTAIKEVPKEEPEIKLTEPPKAVEKEKIIQDSVKASKAIVQKPVIETPLTEEVRDSISSEGFNAYFDRRRNPFKRSSERYEIWQEGWNDGKVEAEKLLEKDPSLKLK